MLFFLLGLVALCSQRGGHDDSSVLEEHFRDSTTGIAVPAVHNNNSSSHSPLRPAKRRSRLPSPWGGRRSVVLGSIVVGRCQLAPLLGSVILMRAVARRCSACHALRATTAPPPLRQAGPLWRPLPAPYRRHAAAIFVARTTSVRPLSRFLASVDAKAISEEAASTLSRPLALVEFTDGPHTWTAAEGVPPGGTDGRPELLPGPRIRRRLVVESLIESGPAAIAGGPSEGRRRRPGRAAVPEWLCPACGQACVRLHTLADHARRCCPDVASRADWERVVVAERGGDSGAAALDLLGRAALGERALWYAALSAAFGVHAGRADKADRGPSGAGPGARNAAGAVAASLGLPEPRAAGLLSQAIKAWPMMADPCRVVRTGDDEADVDGDGFKSADTDVPPLPVLRILFEDDDILAVAKPPGLPTMPRHRHEGNSLFSRVVHYLSATAAEGPRAHAVAQAEAEGSASSPRGRGRPPAASLHAHYREPRGVHRLDADTSGVVVWAKTERAASALATQFQVG